MSLWSGVIGVVFAGISLLLWFRNVEQWKWFLVAGVVSLMIAPYAALIDEHQVRKELETIRPYVLIEEVPAAVIHAYSSQNPEDRGVPAAAYQPSYVMGWGPAAETLMYSVMNVDHVTNGGGVTARGLKHFCRIEKIGASGIKTQVRLPELQNGGEVLFPGRSNLRRLLIPHGTFFSDGKGELDIRVRLVVTYLGQPSDKNLYFYRVVIKTRQFPGLSNQARIRLGSISVESTNEGVVKNPDGLWD